MLFLHISSLRREASRMWKIVLPVGAAVLLALAFYNYPVVSTLILAIVLALLVALWRHTAKVRPRKAIAFAARQVLAREQEERDKHWRTLKERDAEITRLQSEITQRVLEVLDAAEKVVSRRKLVLWVCFRLTIGPYWCFRLIMFL